MISNKKARITMKVLLSSDKHRPVNKRLKNKVVVTLYATALPGTIRFSQLTKK